MDGSDNYSPDTKYEYTILFDFYGALLKDKNYSIFEDYICNDMSLSEIAVTQGITRQGVRDTINRSVKKLIEYEDKLGLIKKFESTKESVQTIKKEVSSIKTCLNDENYDNIGVCLNNIEDMADCILEEM